MKIFNPNQLKQIEKETVTIQQISMNDLMERAANTVFNSIRNEFKFSETSFVILCGVGNNGGDGLALARLLKENGSKPTVYLLKSNNYSEDNLINQNRLEDSGVEIQIFDENTNIEFPKNSVVIDAIMGYGLSRPLEGNLKFMIDKINNSGRKVISIDLASGMFCDKLNSEGDSIVKCDECLTFDSPKFSMLLQENHTNLKNFKILDIGFDKGAVEKQPSDYYFIDSEMIFELKKERNRFTYKYNFGNILLVGGSYGKMGAIQLEARAAMRCGGGLVTAYIPKCGYSIIQSTVPEALVVTDSTEELIIGFPNIDKFNAIAVGPGLGTDDRTAYGFEQFLSENDFSEKKIIIDADGINLISKFKTLLKILPENAIITPHDKELERLIGSWQNTYEKFEKIKELTEEFKIIVVSKGAFTQIHLPDGKVYFNSTGNPGMATAGSGDVLTGMIAGLMGRGYTPKEATIVGIYLHGLSGDLAVAKVGEESLIAPDMVKFIPKALKKAFRL